MGVKDLWNVLGPISHKISLYDLQDKVVAIDLSCWVCEGQSIGERSATIQPRMYLRNVFFRTCTLLLMNVTPVFILEGKAPALKLAVMKQRNDARFKRHQIEEEDETKVSNRRKGGRSRFKGILNQCRDMLALMGVICLESEGEAEALCGQLNRDGLVDAVITQDSDVFLYGAQTVYRNLAIKAGTGTVEVYKMKDIEEKLNLSRDKLVAMSILCGCDYDQAGVVGIGKEMACKYLMNYKGDVLKRLKELRHDKILKRLEMEKNGCSKCCHPGKSSEHRKDGCIECGISKGCNENESPLAFKNLNEDDKKRATLELNIRSKAISESNFPNQETVSEFLHTNQTLRTFSPSWEKPNICKFSAFCCKMLEWDVDYGFGKILPLLTRWLLLKSPSLSNEELVPTDILKKRIVKGVASYDLSWRINDENLSGFLSLMPDDCAFLSEGMCLSTEPQVLVADRLPDVYALFLERTTKKKRPKVPKELKTKKPSKQTGGSSETSKKGGKNSNVINEKKNVDLDNDLPNPKITIPGCILPELNQLVSSSPINTPSNRMTDFHGRNMQFSTPIKEFSEFSTTTLSTYQSFFVEETTTLDLPSSTNVADPENNPITHELDYRVTFSPFDFSSMCSELASKDDTVCLSSHSPLKDVANALDNRAALSFDPDQLGMGHLTLNDTVVLSDDSTVDYDISGIVDDIISRKRFY